MTNPALLRLGARALPLAMAATFACVSPLLAQGTKAEREACTADAIQLCQDTIPDVDKTTVCMKRHFAELSPPCQAVVSGRTDGGPDAGAPPVSHADRGGPDDTTGSLDRPRHDDDADSDDDDNGLRSSRRTIAKLCADGLIDPGTCRRTEQALRDAE